MRAVMTIRLRVSREMLFTRCRPNAWPGNVRELGGEIERLVLYAEKNSYISIEQIHPRILPPDSSLRGNAEGAERSLDELLDDYERQVITQTLKQHDCNIARASAALG